MKRAGFTMIELIFVIVILGILAAVAIPKLAATRDDAKISAVIGNARTVIGDVTAKRTALGQQAFMLETFDNVSNVPATATGACAGGPFAGAMSSAVFGLCDGSTATAAECVTFTLDQNVSTLTVATPGGSTVCDQVALDPAMQAYVAQPLLLGGSQIVR